ncbi:hypothetical protein NQ318_008667 [Aromia moschata]|uniref:HTH CENPB-type domain-containing protein n=1 Tax=Aromia moschata TaxID=1265417 RepID=A0AAV8XBD9_9CUCU|nr:hypothetical protein NQ318_008667 [Aromia moschata]
MAALLVISEVPINVLQEYIGMEWYPSNYIFRFYTLFQKCTFLWFCQKRTVGEPVTGPVLQAKAKQFHVSLNVDSDFSASNGWLARFKKRHGIRCLNIKGEKLSANEDDATPGRKASKDRVTIQVCSNASGAHKIPLTVIGNTSFVYRVEQNPQFFIVYLAPNVTSLIQPMDQGVISALKRCYKTMFLNELLAKEFEEKGTVDELIKKWNLRDCFHLLQNAWDNVTIDTLKNSWKNLLQLHLAGPVQTQTVARLLEVIRHIPSCGEMSLKEVENWIDKEQYEPPRRIKRDAN